MELGYKHPDALLRELTSKQLAEWMAFSTLEPVGKPFPEDPETKEKKERIARRGRIEGTLSALKEKQDGKR